MTSNSNETQSALRFIEGSPVRHAVSILIASIGDNFMNGCLETLVAASTRANTRGYPTTIWNCHDLCVTPFHGLGAMRNMAFMEALRIGADKVILVDNDIRMDDTDIVWRLAALDKLAVAPFYDLSECCTADAWARTGAPMPYPDQGLIEIEWIATSCVMFDTAIFKMIGPRLFLDPLIANEESYIWRYLALYGVRLWQATDLQVMMLRPPTRLCDAIPGGRQVNPEKPMAYTSNIKKAADDAAQ